MAHESSNPKIRGMFLIAIAAALSLAIFDQIFKSYFTMMMEEEESEKVLTVAPKQLLELRAADQQRLTSAALPIDRAMKEMAMRGRDDPSLKDLAKTDISAQPSNDLSPQVGWNGLVVTTPAPVGNPAPTSSAPYVNADGGPTFEADAGKML